jgi:hypothetical protein
MREAIYNASITIQNAKGARLTYKRQETGIRRKSYNIPVKLLLSVGFGR